MISFLIVGAVVVGIGAWLRWAIVPVMGAYRLGRVLEQRVAAMNARRDSERNRSGGQTGLRYP